MSLRTRLLALLAALAWAAMIHRLCTGTRVPVGPWFPAAPFLYNLAHAPLFGLLSALLGVALRPAVSGPVTAGRRWRHALASVPGPAHATRGAWLAAAALALGYGVAIEWLQAAVPGRHASGLDVLTDAVGALAVPWALASGRLFGPRTVVAILVASVAAALATWA